MFSLSSIDEHWMQQTLTQLNLGSNKISNRGVYYIANVLEINKVRETSCLYVCFILVLFYLEYNSIGSQR